MENGIAATLKTVETEIAETKTRLAALRAERDALKLALKPPRDKDEEARVRHERNQQAFDALIVQNRDLNGLAQEMGRSPSSILRSARHLAYSSPDKAIPAVKVADAIGCTQKTLRAARALAKELGLTQA